MWRAILFLGLLFCLSCGPYPQESHEGCAEIPVYEGPAFDMEELYWGVNEACRNYSTLHSRDPLDLLQDAEIRVVSTTREDIQSWGTCGCKAQACIQGRKGSWHIKIRSRTGPGSGKNLRHEMLHLLFWEVGVVGEDQQHALMRQHGWY